MKNHYKLQATVFIEKELIKESICESISKWLNDETAPFPEYALPFLINPNCIVSRPFTVTSKKVNTVPKRIYFNVAIESIGMALYAQMTKKSNNL